jgi:hypothetical protein
MLKLPAQFETKSDGKYLKSREEIVTPIFIVGAGRSGTTLLYKLLCLHPQIAWFSNYVNRFPFIPWVSAVNSFSNLSIKLTKKVWFSKESNAYFSRKNLFRKLFPTPVEGESVFSLCEIPALSQEDWEMRQDQSEKLKWIFKNILVVQGGRKLVNKRTANNRRIKQLNQVFPKAKFIHLVRDGRSVCRSLLKVKWWANHKVWWWENRRPRDWMAEGRDPVVMAARNWVEEVSYILEGLDNVNSARIIEIRYENLINRPLFEMEKITDFIGIEKCRGWLEYLNGIKISDKNIKNGIKINTKAEKWYKTATEVQYDLLEQFGYLNNKN